MRAYLCATCARRCLVVGEEAELGGLRCICGGELTSALFPPGQYELIGQGQVSISDTGDINGAIAKPGEAAAGEPNNSNKQDADLGFGASHGNATGREGPTGPGDAPAK